MSSECFGECVWFLNKCTLVHSTPAEGEPVATTVMRRYTRQIPYQRVLWMVMSATVVCPKIPEVPEIKPTRCLSDCKCPLVAAVSLYHKLDQTPPVVDKLQRVMHFWGMGGRERERSAVHEAEIQASWLGPPVVAPKASHNALITYDQRVRKVAQVSLYSL